MPFNNEKVRVTKAASSAGGRTLRNVQEGPSRLEASVGGYQGPKSQFEMTIRLFMPQRDVERTRGGTGVAKSEGKCAVFVEGF